MSVLAKIIRAKDTSLQVSSSCSSVYVDGSEIRGSSNASVLVKYGTYTGLAKFTVWMPEFPLEVNVADFRLSQVKGWKVPGDHTSSVKMKRSLDDLHGNRGSTYRGWGDSGAVSPDDLNGVDPDRHLSCRIRFQQSPVEPLQDFGPHPRLQEVPLDPTPPSRYCSRLYTGATGGGGIDPDVFNRCSRIWPLAELDPPRRQGPEFPEGVASLVGDTGAATRGGGPSPGPAVPESILIRVDGLQQFLEHCQDLLRVFAGHCYLVLFVASELDDFVRASY
uniref:Uncharacterized protein n=1 Tax=Timema monikensis TaxID=170555 RepID=A0A7R9EB61_9NEOP|nr:unnamed protein product [Timema monikensis]